MQLVTKNQSVMYNFFNWPALRHSRLIVLAVANTMDPDEGRDLRILFREDPMHGKVRLGRPSRLPIVRSISGTPGTGKTATVREVVAQLNAAVHEEEMDDFITKVVVYSVELGLSARQ
jgi:Cdc6-like AAA superfamily ATPase